MTTPRRRFTWFMPLRPDDEATPLICLCHDPWPEPCGQCAHCLRVIPSRMSAAHQAAALAAYPELSQLAG